MVYRATASEIEITDTSQNLDRKNAQDAVERLQKRISHLEGCRDENQHSPGGWVQHRYQLKHAHPAGKNLGEIMRVIAVSTIAAFLTACASSGVVPIGQDTFMITKQSATVFATGGGVKAEVYREGYAYCSSIGKEFQPVVDKSVDGIAGRQVANAEIQFRCLSKGDSELQRPTMRPNANIRIENVQAK